MPVGNSKVQLIRQGYFPVVNYFPPEWYLKRTMSARALLSDIDHDRLVNGSQQFLPWEPQQHKTQGTTHDANAPAAVMAAVLVEETDEARWAKMPPRLRTRDQKRVLHNRTAVERGLHLFPPFKSMDEWTVKCLRCERDIDLWTWSGQNKIFNSTARLELKCGGDEFHGEEHSAVRRNGAVNPAIRQLQNQNNKKERQTETIGECSREGIFSSCATRAMLGRFGADVHNAGCTENHEI